MSDLKRDIFAELMEGFDALEQSRQSYPGGKLVCPKCGVDRLQQACQQPQDCALIGTAQ